MIRTFVSNSHFILSLWLSVMTLGNVQAQSITIDSVHTWSEQNYPLIAKAELIRRTQRYTLANLAKGYLPQISTTAQATYQSDVITVPIPNTGIEPLSKDQYKAYADLNQTIYDGGAIAAKRQLQRLTSSLESAGLEKDLYALRERVNQLFFGALLLHTQQQQINLLIEQLRDTKKSVDSAVRFGAAYRSDADQLASEILIQQQRLYEIEAGIAAYLQMLQAFTGHRIDNADDLQAPIAKDVWMDTENNRPELKAFELRNKLYDKQLKLLQAQVTPRLSLFGQGGYGKPGLNQLKNEFDWYYIAGERLIWKFSALYTLKNEKRILQVNRQENNVQRETFLFNNRLSQIQQANEKLKTDQLIATDQTIIALKENIREAAKAKYENGVITLNDYLKELNAVSQAKLNQELHKIQALSNQYNRQFTTGN